MEYCAPMTHKIETNHPLFRRDDDDTEKTQLQNDTARLVKTTFVGKFVPVKWSCRAPMRNGKLCPRMDPVKCPLHGRIVARDETGRIEHEKDRLEFEATTQKSSKPKDTPWLDKDLIADINATSGRTVISSASSRKEKKREASKRQRDSLTKLPKETSRSRLERRLLHPKNLSKIGSILDSIERRQNYEKFHHNFQYALQS